MAHPVFRQLVLAGMTLASHPVLAEEPAEKSGGLPQMDTTTYASQLFWLFACFAVLYLLMSKLALPRVAKVLETRRLRIEGDLADAQRLKEDADKVKTVYEKSLAEAQRSAATALAATERAISEKISEEQSRFADSSRKRLAAAEQAINKARAEALHSLTDIAADIAADMANKVADIQVSKADAKKAVTSASQKG
jgi:F-type H+-transporting ATPase subunit b